MAEQEYQRLTRSRARGGFSVAFQSRSALWLGKDHLLCVDTTGYTETYKRFYFRDIQALTIRATSRRGIWNWVLAIPTGLCVIGWSYYFLTESAPSLAAVISALLVTLVFALPLLFNNLLGPACATQLRTAVQTEDLPSLCRLRQTRRILDRLRPLIAQAQGSLAPEEIPARMVQLTQAAVEKEATLAPSAAYVADDPNAPPRIVL